jgi:hypothetical protein
MIRPIHQLPQRMASRPRQAGEWRTALAASRVGFVAIRELSTVVPGMLIRPSAGPSVNFLVLGMREPKAARLRCR